LEPWTWKADAQALVEANPGAQEVRALTGVGREVARAAVVEGTVEVDAEGEKGVAEGARPGASVEETRDVAAEGGEALAAKGRGGEETEEGRARAEAAGAARGVVGAEGETLGLTDGSLARALEVRVAGGKARKPQRLMTRRLTSRSSPFRSWTTLPHPSGFALWDGSGTVAGGPGLRSVSSRCGTTSGW
jgi:hypothetical protein